MTANTYPTAPVLVVIDHASGRTVLVRCPYRCGKKHTHGWPEGSTDVGSRVAHCVGATYIVTGAASAPHRNARRRR